MDSPLNSAQDIQAAVQQFEGKAERLLGSFVGDLPKDPPETVYHYTNGAGLRGILQSGQIWLSDVFSLNDPSELNHGFGIAVELLNTRAAGKSPVAREFAQGLQSFHRRVGLDKSASYFMGSFSSSGDDLGQWRAYADNGRGYALGFDGKALETAFADQGFTVSGLPNTDTFPITYNDAVLAGLADTIIEAYFGLVDLDAVTRSGVALKDVATLYTSLTVALVRASMFFKREAYANEKEFRFLQTFPFNETIPQLKSRVRRYSLVPYKEFDWRSVAPAALREIVVGPAAEARRGREFAEACILESQPESVRICASSIPYRAH